MFIYYGNKWGGLGLVGNGRLLMTSAVVVL